MNPRRRRWLLSGAAATGLTLGAGSAWWWRRRSSALAPLPAPLAARGLNPLRLPDSDPLLAVIDAGRHFTISARAAEYELLPGRPTRMLLYEVEHGERTLFNPILRVRRGAVIQAKFWNRLDQTSIVHWHGLRVDANNDGNPHYAVGPGEIYDYLIPVHNRAGTCWYHPHPHGLTASQVYRGLASFLIVEDEHDDALARALDLTLGTTDLPLLIQDRRIDAAEQFVHAPNGADRFLGYLGAEVMVNYTRRPVLDATPRIYRLRLLNGSSARIFRLAFSAGETRLPFHLIGADAGLLERPLPAQEAFLAPGERLDVLLDLRPLRPGAIVRLQSLAFDPMTLNAAELCITPSNPDPKHAAHATGVSNPSAANASAPITVPPNGARLDILPIRIVPGPIYQRSIPVSIATLPGIESRGARERVIELDHAQGRWRINGVEFDMLATPIRVGRGSVEIWEVRNPPNGMPHPMHFHGFPFKLLQRRSSPEQIRRIAVDARGLAAAETGWKDTFTIWPGEQVRFAVEFSHSYPGEQVYLFHCHNLEHEDAGMMINVRVVPPRSDAHA